MIRLQSIDGWRAAVERSFERPVLLFKHSLACPRSTRGLEALDAFGEPDDPPIYVVAVQEQRALSAAVAADLGLRHATPQLILVYEGRPVLTIETPLIDARTVRRAAAALRR